MARKRYEAKEKLLTSKAMASMRETAFGHNTCIELFRANEHSDRMRNDDQMLADAQAKRDRKAAKRLQDARK